MINRISLNTFYGLGYGLLAIALWSGSFLLTRIGVTGNLTAYDIIALRFGFAAILLLPLFIRIILSKLQLSLTLLFLLVMGGGAPYALFTALGLQFATAWQAASLIPGLMTVITALLSYYLLKEDLVKRQKLGCILILLGCCLVAGKPNSKQLVGFIIFFFGALFWAIYVISVRQKQLNSLQITTIVAVISAIFYLPIYLLLLPKKIMTAPWLDISLQAIYQGGLTTILGLIAFNQTVKLLGTTATAALTALIPIVTLLMETIILGTKLTITAIIFSIIIGKGVFLVSFTLKKSTT